MRSNSRVDEEGMTIVEILVASAISALLLTSLSLASGLFLDSYDTVLDEQELSITHQMAMQSILRSITSAADVTAESSSSLLCTFPDSGTDRFAWSGSRSDPMLLTRDGGDDVPFLDGVASLSFDPVMVNVISETLVTQSQELLNFSTFSGYGQTWDDQTISPGSQHGFTFRFFFVDEVENIVLTELGVRISKFAGQTSDMKVSLYEGQDESRPRIWGDPLASCQIANCDIPEAQEINGEWQIGWMTITLPTSFVIQPNRFYCLLFETEGGLDAGILRVARIEGGTGPINDMAYMGTTDGGATWTPPLKTQSYRDRDVPLQLFGDITTIERNVTQKVGAVDVSLGLFHGSIEVTGQGSAKVRGGGELFLLP